MNVALAFALVSGLVFNFFVALSGPLCLYRYIYTPQRKAPHYGEKATRVLHWSLPQPRRMKCKVLQLRFVTLEVHFGKEFDTKALKLGALGLHFDVTWGS